MPTVQHNFSIISVIVDQVYEMDKDKDLLLLLLRQFLTGYVKIVLLSDDVSAVDNITRYFNAPVVEFRRKPWPHKVVEYFLDRLQKESVILICLYLDSTFFYSIQ